MKFGMKKTFPKFKDTGYDDTLFDETCWQPGRSTINDKEMIANLEIRDKLVILLDFYGIPGGADDPMNGWALALMLAHHHVPGFPPKFRLPQKPAHRPPDRRVGFRDLLTYTELERARREGRSVRQAAHELAEKLRKEGKCDWEAIALENRYYKIRKRGTPTKGMIMAARKVEMSRSTSKS